MQEERLTTDVSGEGIQEGIRIEGEQRRARKEIEGMDRGTKRTGYTGTTSLGSFLDDGFRTIAWIKSTVKRVRPI